MDTDTKQSTDTTRSHVAIRVDKETLDRIDALAPHLSAEWRKAMRSDVLRDVMRLGLEALEKQYGVKQ